MPETQTIYNAYKKNDLNTKRSSIKPHLNFLGVWQYIYPTRWDETRERDF